MSPQEPGDGRVVVLGVVLILGLLVAFWLTASAALSSAP